MQILRRNKKVGIWVVFFLISLVLLSSNFSRRGSWNPLESLVIEIGSPIQNFITDTFRLTREIWLKYFYLVDLRTQNGELQRQVDSLKMENHALKESLVAYHRLQDLLQFKQTTHWPVLAAQVIGWDPTGWFKSVIIDKGRNSGLKVNMPVVNAEGVVGRLVSVAANYSKVLLLIDQNSAVDCQIQRSRDKGIVKGESSKLAKLDYVLKTSDVVVGDLVVTSGFGRVFPKGIPVGEIIEVNDKPGDLFKEVNVRLSVNFSKLEEVLVILKEDLLERTEKE